MWKPLSFCLFCLLFFSTLTYGFELIGPKTTLLKPVDSHSHLKVGDKAPLFQLPSIEGEKVALRGLLERSHVLISFIPGAWTPICSEQWPGYNIMEEIFRSHNTILVGISVESIPSLRAWIKYLGGVWFPVLSDFWPHGEVAKSYGVLRSNGIAERALFLVDRSGTLRLVHIHDINQRPPADIILNALKGLKE